MERLMKYRYLRYGLLLATFGVVLALSGWGEVADDLAAAAAGLAEVPDVPCCPRCH
jgi:hypothetical protein